MYWTRLPPKHKISIILYNIPPQSKTLKSFSMYIPLSCHLFPVKRINLPTLTTTKQYALHKSSYDYSFDPNRIWMPSIQPTKSFPWVLVLLEPHMKVFASTYVQYSTFKKTPTDSNTHAHRLTHTHMYVRTQKHSVTDFKSLFLCFQHQISNVFTSTNHNHNPNSNPNPICWTHVLQQTLTLSPTLTLTKKWTINHTNSKIHIWFQILLHFFSDKIHSHTSFQNSIAYSWFLTSHPSFLTYPV